MTEKAKAPAKAYVSDGTMKFPAGHPEYHSRMQPDGMLLLDLFGNEYSEFRVDTDRDCDLTLYNHENGSRYKLFIYRTTVSPINITFAGQGMVYIVPGIRENEIVRLLIIDIEVAELNGRLISKVGPTSESIDEVIASLNTNAIKLSEDITLNGVSQGSYANGNTIAKDTQLTTILKNFLQVALPVTYSAPTFGITPGNSTVEAGAMVSPTIVPTFTQRDAGAINQYLLQLSTGGAANVNIVNSLTLASYIQSAIQVQDGAHLQYTATASFDEGLTKINNMGEPIPAGKILAGSRSATLTYTGARQAFYGTGTVNVNPANSADIRALSGTKLNPTNGSVLTINIAPGTKRIIIAYPDTLRDVTSIKYVELGNAEVADTFTKINLQVDGANGYAPINYKVFVYIPAVPFGAGATYNATI